MKTASEDYVTDWMRQIDDTLQCKIGTREERDYFSVMHLGGTKILWHRPEDYEHACGVQMNPRLKQAWYERTGKEPMQWVSVPAENGEEDESPGFRGGGERPTLDWGDC